MQKIKIENLKNSIGEEVEIFAWAKTIRRQGGIIFVILRDVTGIAQGVILKSNVKAFEIFENLTSESVVKISGKAKEEKQAPGGIEIEILEVEILSNSASPLPIPVDNEKRNEANTQLRFDWRWIDLRNPENQKIFKTWTYLEEGFREFLVKNNFFQVYAPSFMTSPSESGAEVFEVKYFEKKAYLAQSPQFYKQMAMASGFEKVFMVGPVFRAEPSFTTRHMTEFTGWDFEFSFIDSHFDVMEMEEKALVSAFENLKNKLLPDLEVPKEPFPKLSVSEAKEKLKAKGIKSEKEGDLNPEEERVICELIKEETGSDFVFITDYPISVRPFYHMRHKDNPSLTKSFDLLYKGVEVTTGAQREHRYDVLVAQAKEKGMDVKSLEGYLNFFKFGCPPHGGVGIGPGRIIMKILDLESVKEATFLPRDVNRLNP